MDDVTNPIKLSANESSYGPSPKAVQAFTAITDQLNRYPDGSQTELRQAIAQVHGIDPENIICGNGSAELLELFMRTFLGPGDEVVFSENTFGMCHIFAMAQDAKRVIAPEKDYRIDVGEILKRVTEKTRMVCLATPNNPTGTYLTTEELNHLHRSLPSQVLLVVDAAYAEYVTSDDYSSGKALVKDSNNVVMTRTFSKIYGLPALRIGWAYAPPSAIELVQRLRTPFNANSAAMAAAAAAIKDVEFVSKVKEANAQSLEHITNELTNVGIFVVPSAANFYLMDFKGHQEKTAFGAGQALENHGIIPRPVGGKEDNLLRITVGNDAENEAVLSVLRSYMRDE